VLALLCAGAAPAGPAPEPKRLAIQGNIIELPTREVPPGAKAAFALPVAENDLRSEVLLRFEAILRFRTEGGYSPAARITVNGATLDESHFPVNWGTQHTWTAPNIGDKRNTLYKPSAKAWTVRYDDDRWPPVKRGRYYSPEMAARYAYMFPIAKLLKAGENRIDIQNVSSKYTLQLFACLPREAARIDHLRVGRTTDTTIEIAWQSPFPRHELDYRPAGTAAWKTVANVLAWETPYGLILLRPATAYELRVRGLPRPTADLEGKVVAPKPATSATIQARTKDAPEPRTFEGWGLHPSRPIPGKLTTYPCIESHGGFLWATDCSLRLLRLDPEARKVLWRSKRPLAPWPFEPPKGYMGIPDTAILGDKLWVMYNVQATVGPKRYTITQSRQLIVSYDFVSGEVSEPVFVEPTRPELGSWEGGVEAWRGKLWVMHMDVWTKGAVRRTQIVLRTFEGGKFGKPIIYRNCPTVYPYGPAISVYNDKLLLLFSDLAATERDADREPLLYTLFDGKSFSNARIIQDVGRSRYAKGVQVGDKFLCAYKCSAPYYKRFGYQYHDIAVSIFRPGTDEKVDTVMYVDDRKYNSSPDVCRHGDRVFVVYNKLEHLYGRRDNPAIHHGAFIGSLVPARPAPRR